MTTPQQAIEQFKSAVATRDRHAINEAARALIVMKAPLGKTWKSIATILEKNGEHEDSFAALAVWNEQASQAPEVLFEQAGFHARAGRHRASQQFLDLIPEDRWDPLGQAYLQGTLATNFGDSEVAIERLRSAVDIDPGSGQSWLGLAMAGGIDDSLTNRLFAAEKLFAGRPAVESCSYYYARGRVEHQLKQYEDAFASYAKGAALMRRERPYNREAQERLVEQAMSGWTADRVAELNAQASGEPARQIFITGLPRSGSTLTEQILASHSAVGEGAELNLMRLLMQDMGGGTLESLDAFLASGSRVEDLRSLYSHLLNQRLPGTLRMIDKTVPMSRGVGMMAALFPDAPIIWMRRDPVDAAWSIFSTFFIRGIEWSWAFDDIAHFHNLEDRLFSYWTEMLGDRVLVVPYADLVGDPQDWISRIDRHVGLEFEPAQMEPHLAKRVVATASATQVREPINRKGIGSAQPYLHHMGPFLDAYQGMQG